jgi:DHA2 family multidrug resistance protein
LSRVARPAAPVQGAAMTAAALPDPVTRRLIMLSAMAAAVMNQVDTTIANVALPHMQGTTSASREQITWVLTSYIVSAAIATPLTGWLAGKIGRKRLMLGSIVGFTVASGLCGISVHLEELIAFRILQGLFGSALVPMSQATLLDIYPEEEHGQAMAIFGLAAILGPLAGPLLGGWLTQTFSWHWVFLVNLPIGLVAFLGISAFMTETREERQRRFDMTGFLLLALTIGAMQLMLDRGQIQDWFDSTEICIEAAVAAVGLYLLVVHVSTVKHPFVSLALFADRNYVLSTIIGFFLGVSIYSVLALLPPMLSELMNHPIVLIGMVTAPRGLGTLAANLFIGRVIGKVDNRLLVFSGLMICAASSFQLSRFSLQADDWLVITSGFIQGLGASMVFVPLSTMAFATLKSSLRNEGAALNTLLRNLGAAVGIALIEAMTTRNTAAVQSRLTEGLRPDNPTVGFALPDIDFSIPSSLGGVEHEIVRQAAMVGYVDSFWALFVLAACSAPLVFFLKAPRKR